jgi:hypothetical protein
MAGPFKTFFGALQASTFLTGVSLAFGEEMVHDQSQNLPRIVVVPMGGQFENSPGYAKDLDPTIEAIWTVGEMVDFYLWAYDTTPGADRIDHEDAAGTLLGNLLAALQDQRAQYTDVSSVDHGLYFHPVSERWQTMGDAFTRFGRALVASVLVPIPRAQPAPQVATITSETINYTITAGAPT